MSSLDVKPDLAQAHSLAPNPAATDASTKKSSRETGSRLPDGPSQKTRSDMQDEDIGFPLQSVPSTFNMSPRRPPYPPIRRNGGFSLSDTVVANTIIRETTTDTDGTRGSRTRISGNVSPYPTNASDTGSSRRHAGAHPTQTAPLSQSSLLRTNHAGRRGSGTGQEQVVTRDTEDPTNVTCRVVQDLVSGKMSKEDRSRIGNRYLRAVFGGDAS